MPHSFNLIEQPWIPCIRADGSFCELGLQDTLTLAHDLREIFDDSPLVTTAIYRLLLAILHHNLGPADAQVWASLWSSGDGAFDPDIIQEYFHDPTRHSRFDLFDDDRPFYQTSAVPFEAKEANTKKVRLLTTSIAKLAIELSAGNNDTLFDHSLDHRPPPFPPAQAARVLVACQAYSPGGLVTTAPGEDRNVHGSADASPLINGAVCIVRGKNLFQSLMLNLHLYNAQDAEPFAAKGDQPAWDRDTATRPHDRLPAGYLDLLTWQSRRVRLQPERTEGGATVVRFVVVMKGEQFPDGFHRRGFETMVGFTRNPRATTKQDPWPAVDFTESRVIWRNSLALFQSVEEKRARPKTLDWLNELVFEGVLSRSATYTLDLAGISTDRAKVLLWRQERMPLGLAFLNDDDLVARLEVGLHECEEVAKLLRQSVWHFARFVLVPEEAATLGKEEKKDIQRLVDSFSPDLRYWSRLETPFYEFLRDLPGEAKPGSHEERAHREGVQMRWRGTLQQLARIVFSQTAQREMGSGRSLRASVLAERLFVGLLRKALPEEEVTHG